MVTVVRLLQSWNALTPIVVTELGIVMEVRLLQPLKDILVLVTELGMIKEVRPLQPLKAPSMIAVTELGMTNDVLFPGHATKVEIFLSYKALSIEQ